MTRVQIPVWTDRWMMGDQYGEVVKITKTRRKRAADGSYSLTFVARDVAHVKLDKSGKTLRFLLDDCTVV